MSGKGKGLKNKALAAVRAELEKHGFPKDLQLRSRKQRAEGVGYIASGLVDGKIMKLAKIRYNPDTDTAVLEADWRNTCEGRVVIGTHADPVTASWEVSFPEIKLRVREGFHEVFVNWLKPIQTWPLPHTARLVVKNQQQMLTVVYIVLVKNMAEIETLSKRLNQTQRNHTCFVVWGQNSKPESAVRHIIDTIKKWRKGVWPKA